MAIDVPQSFLDEDTEGWDGLDLNSPAAKATRENAKAKALAIAAKYHALFKQNEAGAEILADWQRQFVHTMIVRPGDDQFAAGIRQGRADLVLQIMQQIDFAENPDGNPQEV